MRCQPCQNLTISRLITLAEEELASIYGFPSSSFYRHHTSIHALEHSARSGCELCSLLLKALPSDDDSRGFNLHTEAVSDIRIAISSSHLTQDLTVVRDASVVQMFDFLLVQAGDDVTGYRRQHLLLLSPSGTAVGRYKIGRDILDSRLSAPSNFAIMRRWLDQCGSKHQTCPDLQQDALLPTRVVDVGGDGVNSAPFLLVSDGTGRGRYAALTHCWGGHIDVVLTKDSLEDFQHRLPVEALAKNFKDALHICHELGVQYLWIDCLCIIQNSEDDWVAESSKMTSIYSKAFVTISALASRGSSGGIFRDHHTRPSDDYSLRSSPIRVVRDSSLSVAVALDSSPETGELAYALRVESDYYIENLKWLHEVSPLTKRAWCLQESLLSPRIIFFGEEQVYWRCFDGFQSADGLPVGNEDQYPSQQDVRFAHALQGLSEVKIRPPPDRWSKRYYQIDNVYHRSGYYHLIREYSKRNLTMPQDKLPAFSALAKRIHAKVGGDYLAGLFTANLLSDLTWSPMEIPLWLDELKHPGSPPYVAPSWSWASAYGEVHFIYQDMDHFMHMDDTAPQQQLRLVESRIRYRDETNPYGQVLPGSSIIVSGLTTRLMLSEPIALGPDGSSGQGPQGICPSVADINWDILAGEHEGQQVLFAPSSEFGEGATCVQQGRGFYVATKDLGDSKPGRWGFLPPKCGFKEIPTLREIFTNNEFLILVVKPQKVVVHMPVSAHCLVLQKTDQHCDVGRHQQHAPVYQRVGTFYARNLQDADWEEMTLEII